MAKKGITEIIPIPIPNNKVVVITSSKVARAGEDITAGSFFILVARIGNTEPNVLDKIIVRNRVNEVASAI